MNRMSAQEAKEILMLYRPGTADAEEPDVIQAMEVARADAELGRWFQQHQKYQAGIQDKLRQIKPPEHLKYALLSRGAQLRSSPASLPWWQKPAPVWAYAAAGLVLIFTLAVLLRKPPVHDRLADYRQSMVAIADKPAYAMPLETSDMNRLRKEIADGGAPADYNLSDALQKLSLTGGGVIHWRGNPVAMVCFDRGNKQMVLLFVTHKSALPDPPPATPTQAKVSDLRTATWTQGDKAYLLAGPDDPSFAHYLPRTP